MFIEWDKRDIQGLVAAIRKAADAANKPAHALEYELGWQAARGIADRTRRGLGAGDRPFAPYTPTYALQRAKRGRTTTPNLMFTGLMLASLSVEARYNQVRLHFVTAEAQQRANVHASQGPRSKMPLRDFLSITETETLYKELTQTATRMFGEHFQRLLMERR